MKRLFLAAIPLAFLGLASPAVAVDCSGAAISGQIVGDNASLCYYAGVDSSNRLMVTNTPSSTPQGITPVATATDSGITIVKSLALESNHVLKASAGNLYSVYVTTGATAGWLLTYNGTSAPTAGGAAIAPVDCVIAPANSTVGISMGGDPPDAYATGIVAIFSSSGCLTNTASSTVFFKGRIK